MCETLVKDTSYCSTCGGSHCLPRMEPLPGLQVIRHLEASRKRQYLSFGKARQLRAMWFCSAWRHSFSWLNHYLRFFLTYNIGLKPIWLRPNCILAHSKEPEKIQKHQTFKWMKILSSLPKYFMSY